MCCNGWPLIDCEMLMVLKMPWLNPVERNYWQLLLLTWTISSSFSRNWNDVSRRMCWQSDIIQTYIFSLQFSIVLHLLWQSPTANQIYEYAHHKIKTDGWRRHKFSSVGQHALISTHLDWIVGKMHAVIFQRSQCKNSFMPLGCRIH